MPLSQAELVAELATLKRLLQKALGELRPADQVADISFHINVQSAIS